MIQVCRGCGGTCGTSLVLQARTWLTPVGLRYAKTSSLAVLPRVPARGRKCANPKAGAVEVLVVPLVRRAAVPAEAAARPSRMYDDGPASGRETAGGPNGVLLPGHTYGGVK
ncbi:hypothetical protein GCM10010393_21790 [Streptomyces gobitricini]|uniref:Uncharacterized protein n=1 Tax=Streptomyces gobitricini TaxID=68211 RepID=A0ABP5YZH9_9ACTN